VKPKKTMKVRHLGTKDINDCSVIVEVQILSTGKVYKYSTSRYFEGKFLSRYKGSYGGWASLNFLKENSEMLQG
jgi:hypothetical protein